MTNKEQFRWNEQVAPPAESLSLEIPDYLISRGFACPIENYTAQGWESRRVTMFQELKDLSNTVKTYYGFEIPIPPAIPLTHRLWQEYVTNNQKLTIESENALLELFANRINRSRNNGINIRHGELDKSNGDSGASSDIAITDPHAALKAVYRQYEFFYESKHWNNRDDVEVALTVVDLVDPPAIQTTREGDEDKYTSGHPPVGVVVTTDADGERILVDVVLGDNLAAQHDPSIADHYEFNFTPSMDPSIAPPILTGISNKAGHRTHIWLDRGGKVAPAIALPPDMQVGLIPINLGEVVKVAIAGGVASQKSGHACKLEGSINSDTHLELNQLSEFHPPAPELLKDYEPQYQAIGLMDSINDLIQMKNLDANQLNLPGLIAFGQNIGTSIEVSQQIVELKRILSIKIGEADAIHRPNWEKLLILTSGAKTAHHFQPILKEHTLKLLNKEKIPPINAGDIIHLEQGVRPGDIWVRNSVLSGDGVYVVSTKFWAKEFSAEHIGAKAKNRRDYLERLDLDTLPSAETTDHFFFKMLEINGAREIFDSLPDIDNEDDFINAFISIGEKLRKIPRDEFLILTKSLMMQVPNWENKKFVARSNHSSEDIELDNNSNFNFSGTFESYLDLNLDPNSSTPIYLPSHKPANLAAGTLEVARSAFIHVGRHGEPSDPGKIARYIFNLPHELKAKLLAHWTMEIEHDLQSDSIISGTVVPYNVENNLDLSVITIQAQTGKSGVVDDDERPLLTIKLDADTLEPNRIYISGQGKSIDVASFDELAEHFPDTFTLFYARAIGKVAKELHQYGKADEEWSIEKDSTGKPKLWWLQTR